MDARVPQARTVGLWLAVLAVLLSAGCATNPPRGVQIMSAGPSPATLRLPPNAAQVGIISTSSLPLLRIQWPLRRQEALGQVSDEADNLLYHAAVFFPAAFATVPYLTARAASAGAAGLSDTEFQQARQTYGAALPLMLVHDGLRRTVVDQARARGWTNYTLVPKPYPPGDRAQFEGMAYFIAATLAWLPKGMTVAEYLRTHQADPVLELRIRNAALAGKLGTDRPLALSFDLEAGWWSVAQNTELSRLELRYGGRQRRFSEWMANGGEPFLVELQSAYLACAEVILDWCSPPRGAEALGRSPGLSGQSP